MPEPQTEVGTLKISSRVKKDLFLTILGLFHFFDYFELKNKVGHSCDSIFRARSIARISSAIRGLFRDEKTFQRFI